MEDHWCPKYRAKRIRIEPRSGDIPLAQGVSPGFDGTRLCERRRRDRFSTSFAPPGLDFNTTLTPRLRTGLEECRRSAAQYGCAFSAIFLFKRHPAQAEFRAV